MAGRLLRSPGAALCLAAAFLGPARQAWAQSARSVQTAQKAHSLPRVDVSVVESACDASDLQTKVGSWFAGSKTTVSTHSERKLDPDSVLAPSPLQGVRLWIAARNSTTVALYFAVQPEPGVVPRFLVRDIALDHGFDELGMEQLAQVIFLSSLALWSGQLQSPKSQLEERLSIAAPAAQAVPSRSFGWALHSEMGYGIRLQGREGIAQGLLGALRVVRGAGDLECGGRLAVQLFFPRRQYSDPVALDLRGYSLHAAAWLSQRGANGLSLTAEFGPGLDVIRYAVNSVADSSVQPRPAHWEIRPIAWLAAGIEGAVSRVRLGLSGSLAIQLYRTHYDIVDAGQRTKLLTPWLIQPGFAAYIAF